MFFFFFFFVSLYILLSLQRTLSFLLPRIHTLADKKKKKKRMDQVSSPAASSPGGNGGDVPGDPTNVTRAALRKALSVMLQVTQENYNTVSTPRGYIELFSSHFRHVSTALDELLILIGWAKFTGDEEETARATEEKKRKQEEAAAAASSSKGGGNDKRKMVSALLASNAGKAAASTKTTGKQNTTTAPTPRTADIIRSMKDLDATIQQGDRTNLERLRSYRGDKELR